MHTKLTLEISNTAEHDLKKIWEHKALANQQEAYRSVQKIAHKIFTLEYLADQYSELPESELFGIPYRQLDVEDCQVLFQVDKNHVQVLRIL